MNLPMPWHITDLRVGNFFSLNPFIYFYCESLSSLIDLFVCIDKRTLASRDISSNYPPRYNGKSLGASEITQSDANLMVFAFVAVNQKNYRDKIAVGYLKMKREQLSLLGYHVVIVSSIHDTYCILFRSSNFTYF